MAMKRVITKKIVLNMEKNYIDGAMEAIGSGALERDAKITTQNIMKVL